jgi:hypothetical protein
MTFRNRLGCVLGAVLALGMAEQATAQTSCISTFPAPCSTTGTSLGVTINISRAVLVTLSPGSTTLAPPTVADYNAGYAATTGPTATVKANTAWTLSISSATATWSAVDTQTEPARVGKPASDLLWSATAGGTFVGLTTTPVQISAGTLTGTGTPVTLFYRANYAWTLDTPGNYTLPVVFTLTAP